MQAKGKRTRRWHSEEFRAAVVEASREPGVSVSAVALANGLNANLLRRWIKESGNRRIVGKALALNEPESLTVVPVTFESEQHRNGDPIRIDIRRNGMAVQMAWPGGEIDTLGVLLKELLR